MEENNQSAAAQDQQADKDTPIDAVVEVLDEQPAEAAEPTEGEQLEQTEQVAEQGEEAQQPAEEAAPLDPLADNLTKAWLAYRDKKLEELVTCCNAALELDPENAEAWELLARLGGWDPVQCTHDMDFIMDAIARTMDKAPEHLRHKRATDIYTDRKSQIATRLSAATMMPSHTSCELIQQIMQDWLTFLRDTPFLTPSIVQREIDLCENLCKRSRRGVVPGERLIYASYSSLNNKVSYGEMFRQELAPLISGERNEKSEAVETALKHAKELQASYQEKKAAGMEPAEEKEFLTKALETIDQDVEGVYGVTERGLFVQQLEELEKQLAALKAYELVKRHDVKDLMRTLRERIQHIDVDLGKSVVPLQEIRGAFVNRLEELD